MLNRYFMPEDLERIEEAVRHAEAGTAGEIVPYVVEASDEYAGAAYRGAAFGAVALSAAAGLIHAAGGFWGPALAWIVLPALAGALLGYAAVAWSSPLRRLLTPDELLDLRTSRRAAAAFVEREVFATRDRTGILLFLSLFEHRVVVLADAGIHAKVAPPEWDGIVHDLAAGIHAGRPAEALVAAIERCGTLLAEAGVARRDDDVDELPNVLVTGDDR